MDLYDRIRAVMLARQQGGQLCPIHQLLEPFYRAGEVLADLLPFLGELQEGFGLLAM